MLVSLEERGCWACSRGFVEENILQGTGNSLPPQAQDCLVRMRWSERGGVVDVPGGSDLLMISLAEACQHPDMLQQSPKGSGKG